MRLGVCRMALSAVGFVVAISAYAEEQDIKLGFAAPMTGAQAHYGQDMRNGIVLAIEDMNGTKPMIGGRVVKFVLVTEDDQADPKTAVVVAHRLVDYGVKGILGHFNSGTSIAAAPVYANAGIPQIAMATAPAYSQKGYKTAFRMMTSDTQQGLMMGLFVTNILHAKNIAVLDDRTAYGKELADVFEKGVKSAGGNVVFREYASDKSVDFKVALTNVKRSNPEVIFYGGAELQSAFLAKQAKQLGIEAAVVSGEMSKTEHFVSLAGQAAEGMVASVAGLPIDQMPGGLAYAKKYERRFGGKVQTYSPYAYDGAMAMMGAMVKARSSDPARYLPVLAATNMPGVATATVAYDIRGDLKSGGVTIYKVVNGRWQTLMTMGGRPTSEKQADKSTADAVDTSDL